MLSRVRKYHKWLMAFVGIQFLFWSITGVYMVTMDIHYIHGESLAKSEEAKIDLASVDYSIAKLAGDYPQASQVMLTQSMGEPLYSFLNGEKGKVVIDAKTGLIRPLVDEAKAREIARFYYKFEHGIDSINLISSAESMPAELSPRHLPVWRVTFEQFATPTFYISQQTGAIVAKRHDYWRLFDWMWRFHIMDYDDGENVSNWFLFLVATLGLLAALAGAVLTYFRVLSPKKEEVV
ncbi:MAG: PepSY domain-containing protein [Alteromonadaceae bacterium]|nr:PepSY domain-containing protein [Alteromonadaceae bacterium]